MLPFFNEVKNAKVIDSALYNDKVMTFDFQTHLEVTENCLRSSYD